MVLDLTDEFGVRIIVFVVSSMDLELFLETIFLGFEILWASYGFLISRVIMTIGFLKFECNGAARKVSALN